MASRMMQAEASRNKDLDLNNLMSLFGRLYQLRDDYQDIAVETDAAEYDDLDEGNFTLPLLHALEAEEQVGGVELQSILQAAKQERPVSQEMKRLVRENLEDAGSFEFTRAAIQQLYAEMKAELTKMEETAGVENWILRLLMLQLKL